MKTLHLQDQVIRRLAIIGEAVKGLPKDFRDKHKTIAWKDIAGMRDILVHEYYDVDALLVWRVAKNQLPLLLRYVRKTLVETEI